MDSENFFLISKDDVTRKFNSQLFGYAFTDDALIFGTKGLDDYLLKMSTYRDGVSPIEFLNEGRFAAFISDGKTIRAKTDLAGQEMIYYFTRGDDWIVSNSFMLLAQKASERYELSFYKPAALGFHLKDGFHIGEQLLSHRTMVEEIRLLPINKEIEIDLETGHFELVPTVNSLFENKSELSYEQMVIDTLEIGSGLLSAIIRIGAPLNLFLSGGYDSRVVLSMLLKGNGDKLPERAYVTSLLSKQNDFISARNLADKFGFELNNFQSPPQIEHANSSSDALLMYLKSCGGTYLPFYPVSSFKLSQNFYFRITGDQPTGWSVFSGSGIFNGTPQKIANDIESFSQNRGFGSILKDEFLNAFSELGIDLNEPLAMLKYYAGTRSRHHCGRNAYKSLGNVVLITPLVQSRFVALEVENSQRGNEPKQLFCDLFSAIGSWALYEPFESEERGFDQAHLDKSPFKSGASITPRHIECYGRPSDMFQKVGLHEGLRLPVDFRMDVDEIKNMIHKLFYSAKRAKSTDLFSADDLQKCVRELRTRGDISHNYRKTMHVITVDMVLKIIEKSRLMVA